MDAKLFETSFLSPFLPGTNIQYAWDSTSLGYLKRCPRLYFLIIIEGWQAKDNNVHLRFGIELHFALAQYQTLIAEGYTHDDAVHQVAYDLLIRVQDWDVDTDTKAGKLKNPRTLLRTVVWYLDNYENDTAETLRWPDGTPAVEQSFRFELKDFYPEVERNDRGQLTPKQPYLLSGHLDEIKKYQGDLFVMDHKTTTYYLSPKYFDQWEPENQMTLYTLASQVVLGSPVKGVIIDAIEVKAEASKFGRGFTFRDQGQLTEWVKDLKIKLRENEAYAKANYWPQNDTACDKYGGCMFREICSRSPKVRQRFLEADFVQLEEKDRWNPLKAR